MKEKGTKGVQQEENKGDRQIEDITFTECVVSTAGGV